VSEAGLRAGGLCFGYAGAALFAQLELRIAPGEMVALIGPNGSGKTTLMKLLAGTLRASEGGVTLDGAAVAGMPARARARRIAVVPQEGHLAFDFTVREAVLMGRTAHLGPLGIEGPADLTAATEALQRTGTRHLAARMLSRLSGGERQLVVIARALAQQPDWLLLDEPTAFLDIRHRLEIFALLSRLNQQEGLTIVTTSHDINLAARYCRRIVLLKGGRIRADGTPAEVFQAGVLSDVYETPLRVERDARTGMPVALPEAGGVM